MEHRILREEQYLEYARTAQSLEDIHIATYDTSQQQCAVSLRECGWKICIGNFIFTSPSGDVPETTQQRGGFSSRGGGRGGGRGGSTTGYRPPPQQGQFPRPPGQEPYQGGRGGFQRRPYERPRGQFDTPINDEIEADEVRVTGEDREPLGIMSLMEALDMADESGVDVVLITPDADPPVVRLIEYSKYKFEQAKASKEASKKQREARQDLKELKFRPSTDVHDYQVRLRAAQKFIAKGDKVKLTLTFKGREMQFQEIGKDLFKKFVEDVGDTATVIQDARMMGNQMTLLLSPNKNK
ncbi:hypothetical protein WJX75_001091 [Coccomyxa subellipsoidea]|uniref:Translation initiation factor IF-3 n=1 Tax=Coccomyxa subellipsoidea TaxID=248742 RepID=A0ABR2YR06_9CHLO